MVKPFIRNSKKNVNLQVEADPTSRVSQQPNTLNEILRTANDFSNEDLFANRNGKVTISQLVKKPFANIFFQLVIFMLVLMPAAFIIIPLMFNIQPLVVVGIMFFIGILLSRNTIIDIVFPNLQQVQGRAHKTIENIQDWKGRHHYYRYYYIIGKQRFEVNNKTAYAALIDGLEYQIYYLPRTNRLISIENISGIGGNSGLGQE